MLVRNSLKLNALRAQVKAGTDALERGDVNEVDDADHRRHVQLRSRGEILEASGNQHSLR